MRIKENFVVHKTDGQQVMIDVTGRFSGLVRNNSTAAFIVECLMEETTVEGIVDKMAAKYDVSKEVLRRDVTAVLEQFRKVGAIEE